MPRKLLFGVAYSAWFAFVFLLLTWLTFPWSKVRDQAIVGAHSGGTSLQMSSLSAGPFGAEVKDLSVAPLAKGGEAKAPWLQADRVKLETGPIAMLKGALEYRAIASEGKVRLGELLQRMIGATGSTGLDADLYGGEFEAEVEGDESSARIKIEAKKLDLSQYPIRAGMFEADPTGSLNSNIDVVWNWEDPRKTSGSVDIELGSLVLAGFKASGFAMPQAAFDRSEAHLKIKSGKAEFRDTSFESEVVTAEVGGFITLKKKFMRSTLSLNVKFKVRDNLDSLLQLAVGKDPRHRDDEGWYHYQILGNLKRPNVRPSPIKRRGSAPAPRPPVADTGDDDDDDDSEPRTKRRVKDRRARGGDDAIERPAADDERRKELEERRTKLREERRARRERQREARRKRALDRAAQLDPNALEDIEPIQPGDDIERVNEPDLPEDLEIDGDFNEGDGDFNEGDGTDYNNDGGDGGDYQD